MVELLKVWVQNKDTKQEKFGSKPYFFDTRNPIEGIEGCKLKKESNEIECTKIFFSSSQFIIVQGTPFEFMESCKDESVALCILSDLYANGLTVKQFLEQNGKINNVGF